MVRTLQGYLSIDTVSEVGEVSINNVLRGCGLYILEGTYYQLDLTS